ncbi:MAG: type I pullulanase [Patescibacteria group bacterium]
MEANVKTVDCREIDFEDYFYSGDDLGVNYNPKLTTVKIWSPLADRVELVLYSEDSEEPIDSIVDLERSVNGTWKKKIKGDWAGFYYIFNIHYGEEIEETIDPYAKAVGVNSKRGLIVDLSKTNPKGWDKDQRKEFDNPSEAIIYELHVRDFSSSPDSGIENKGMYLAFTEEGTVNNKGEKTGINHLKELGITHVHLLPVFDFASVCDEDKNYNWGYDPFFYNVPEGSYASNPSDESRIREFKQLVKALHDNDIGVIIDVVYNHTYYSKKSAFQKIAPNYFYRLVNDCFANGSGCGNEIATERPMVRKFIIDSVCYWAKEYHIDGFRFDLMALIDTETIKKAEEELHKIDSSILIYGEPWSALDPQLDWDRQMTKGKQRDSGVAVFNDNFREAIKNSLLQKEDKRWELKKGLVGSIGYNQSIQSFAYKPIESINYVSCHDNLTLWDEISSFYSSLSEKKRIKMHRLAIATVLTSQGIPFIQGGSEFLRTKYFNTNSYNAGDYYNQLKWSRKSKYRKTFNYYKGLIELRKNHPAFTMARPSQIKKSLEFLDTPYRSVGFKLKDNANGDSWETIYVFYNFQDNWIKYEFEEKKSLAIVVDDKRAGVKPFNSFTADNVKVPPISAMVLKKKQKSNQK